MHFSGPCPRRHCPLAVDEPVEGPAGARHRVRGVQQAGVVMQHEDDSIEGKHHLGRVDLFDETVFYTAYQDGRPVKAFEVSPADLAAAFAGLPLATGLLPRDCLFYARQAGEERFAIFLQATTRTVRLSALGQKAEYIIPLPPLVFVGRGGRYAVHAVKQYPRPDARAAEGSGAGEGLFRAPLPNVYGEDGRICQGSVKFPACSARTIHQAADLFFDSEFNLDLAGAKSQKYGASVVELWKELHAAGKKGGQYPLSDLVPARYTLADLVTGGRDG